MSGTAETSPAASTAYPARQRPASTAPDDFLATTRAILAGIETVIDGKHEQVELALTTLLAEGHLLVEDVPGVGKTMLARALAKSLSIRSSRVQFTPDLLPSDITGVSIYDQQRREFEFKPGPIFANVVVGDEINRASPKTQSALLEAMEERQVSVDGVSHPLPTPFTVVATQNPIEMEGTYALPEAQRDRFMVRISMGYPDAESEIEMLRTRERGSPLDALEPVIDRPRLLGLIAAVRAVYVSPAIERYIVAIVAATRTDRELRLGASPRASLQLMRASRARAALRGRDFVLPDDVDALAVPVLAHRLVAQRTASSADAFGGTTAAELVERIIARTPVPVGPAQ